jgi:hypothetical protein
MKPNNPSSDHDWTIHSLNIQGTFFEQWCEHIIDEHPRWRVRDKQYPVAFSPTVGPLQNAVGHESTLDLRAELGFHDGRSLTLLVECKKSNPDFVEWVFFSKPGAPPNSLFIAPAVSCSPDSIESGRPLLKPMFTELYFDVVKATDGRETRGDYQNIRSDKKKTKTANDFISNAAHQVAIATQGIFLEEASNNLPEIPIKGVRRRRVEKQVFLPVIVTTARLRMCDFDPSEISQMEGTIPYDSVKIVDKPYLIFDYALPVHLQLDRGHVLLVSSKKYVTSLVRMNIFIVNSGHFLEFLGMLHSRFSDFFYDMNTLEDD